METLEQQIKEKYSNLQEVQNLGVGGGLSFLKEEHNLHGWTIQIVRSQWTKTQGTWCIRIPNYYTGNKHFLQIPNYSLKSAKQFIENFKNDKFAITWTGHRLEA